MHPGAVDEECRLSEEMLAHWMDLVIICKPCGRKPLLAHLPVHCPHHFSSSALAVVDSALESMIVGREERSETGKRE